MARANGYNVVVVGATGLVGRQFLEIMLRRRFPVKSLRLLASARSAGKRLRVGEDEIEVEETTPNSFDSADLCFISATTEVSRQLGPVAAAAGAVVIDDSSAFRMEPKVPLVVPEVNGDDLAWHKGVVAIPNCSTTPLVMALWPLHQVNPLRRVVVDTYQSVSGTGSRAVEELREQARSILAGDAVTAEVYPHQIAFNLLPHIDSFLENGYSKEEWKMVQETRKIMHEPELAVSATCVRVPVLVSHSEAVHVELARPIEPQEARRLLGEAPGLVVQDEPDAAVYPQPWAAAGKDEVFVGRVRGDSSHPNGLALWLVVDNLRKGAALNAIQIAEELIARKLI
ncbi:MAG: aspartate-semialdehyde dehydrogenase [Dehalococcoidia bacterium]